MADQKPKPDVDAQAQQQGPKTRADQELHNHHRKSEDGESRENKLLKRFDD